MAEEMSSLLGAFSTFYLILCTHYLLVPLRDEAGVALGTQILPTIFLCSLVAALAAAPITSYFLSRTGVPRGKGIQQLFFSMTCILFGFFLLYAIAFAQVDNLSPGKEVLNPEVSPSKDSSGVQPILTEDAVKYGKSQQQPMAQGVHFIFFLWIGVQSLASMSAVWARCADVFSPDAALRLYGFIGGGATLGQLTGSFVARYIARAHSLQEKNSNSTPFILVFVACITMFLASRMSQAIQPIRGSSTANSLKAESGSSGSLGGRLSESLRMILSSNYLLHLCAFLLLTYCTASLYYFERSLVVSKAVIGSNERTAWFATLNMYSSSIVACIQLTATGRLLKAFGMPISLSLTPLFACLGLFMVWLNPAPDSVMGAEVLRKVATYAIARPAREGLFSVLSTEEKYKAKVFIDTIVQRLGDTMGAGFFQVIEGFLSLGPQMVAGMGMLICSVWVCVGFSLGRRNQALVYRGLTGVSHLKEEG